MNATHWRRLIVVPAVALLALLVVACGGPSAGDVEGQVLAMRDATKAPQILAGANVVIASANVEKVTQTDAEGKYSFKDLPAGDYGIAFSVPTQEGEAALQPEERHFNVSPGKVETVSVVMLGDGIAQPEVPAELAQAAQSGQAISPGSGMMNNPFFWYFVFNQPWLGGFGRPPVVIAAGPERTITVDNRQPTTAAPGRSFTNYGPAGTPGTKPAPVVVPSKGVTRPGQSALPGAAGGAAAADPSKGAVRPGPAPAAATGGGSAGSGGGQSTSPPRTGAGSGSTAGRAPSSSGGSRSVSPPRVRVGRR
ncbi:MAG TPA: carboxypeptidase-like regulatory domain-containing protein [Chloroflexota bacterium]|nr:carboxypeptidase-like regulatory domain-containing protein [Chloroflexota bacterium]